MQKNILEALFSEIDVECICVYSRLFWAYISISTKNVAKIHLTNY